MIKLEKDISTSIVVTFAPKTTVANPHYLIQIFNVADEVVESFTPTDTSTTKERYNEFLLTTTLRQGEYYYTAYQSETINPTISDVVGEPVNFGIVTVSSSDDILTDIYL
jgi:hypothetical protein